MRETFRIAGIVSCGAMLATALLMTPGGSPAEARDGSKAAPARVQLERGRYLVENVMICFACHSDGNWKPGGRGLPLIGKKGAGAYFPDETVPFRIVAPNLTPDRETGLGAWTDAEIDRAIREGIGRDGRRLFPVMPYLHFRQMSDADLAAVIAYLRALPPVRSSLPKTPVPEPFKALLPPPMPLAKPVAGPNMKDPVKRGAYLVALGDCVTCHTPINERGEPRMDLAFSGGRLLKGPWGSIYSANITPDASGISYYDEKVFIQMMRTGKVGGVRELNPVMLTGYFRGMTDEDLRAIFAYLKTLKPVQHRVDNAEPPAYCKRCRYTHGYGNKN
jgi:mono/diheme cytochrome c family protein